MEFVATSTDQLNSLAEKAPSLRPYWGGALPCNRLPRDPIKSMPRGYIVNTDRESGPGRHWIALWTYDDVCEKMDSYGLPMEVYESSPLAQWIEDHWEILQTNRKSLQAVNSMTCGHYALKYLIEKSNGRTLEDFLKQFSNINYVANDAKIARWMKKYVYHNVIKSL